MADIKIKKEHLKTYVAFGKGDKPLGEREDINDLAIIAIESQDPTLLDLFDNLPDTTAGLKKSKTDKDLKAVASAAPTTVTKAEAKKAVPAPFNKNTKPEEISNKTPSSGPDSI